MCEWEPWSVLYSRERWNPQSYPCSFSSCQMHDTLVSSQANAPFIFLLKLQGQANSRDFYFHFFIFIFFILKFLFLLYFTLQYCIGFALHWHESTTGAHAFPNLNHPPPHLPPHNISLGHHRAPAPSMLYPALNIDWRFDSYMIPISLEWLIHTCWDKAQKWIFQFLWT